MKRRLLLFVLLLIISSVVTCSSQNPDAEILAVVASNIEAMKHEDIEGIKQTIDGTSPGYNMTIDMTKDIFQQYDLQYTMESMKVIEKKGDNARVWFIQITEKVNGPAFRDNKLTGIHTLRKIDGKWYLSDTEIVDVKYLDE